MLRNFSIVNGFAISPMRVCLNRTGPVEVSFTNAAIRSNTGDNRTSNPRLAATSSIRLSDSATVARRRAD
jgi:hypothetical protein